VNYDSVDKMDSTEPSNKTTVALVLKNRGFLWSSPGINEVISKSSSISFDEEWNEFIEAVQGITGIFSRTDPTPAWNIFKHVIDPSAAGDPANVGNPALVACSGERAFDTALFKALRESLDGFVDETVDENWIVLKNSIIAFGRNIQRATLGFEKGYVLSGDSESDHSCFVLGSEAIGKLKTENAMNENAQERECKTRNNEEGCFWFNDMTATIELKLENSSCASFNVIGNSIERPSLSKFHSPMGQAIMYTMDTWHCLARRGMSVESIPVVVLAGRREKQGNATGTKQAKQEKEMGTKSMPAVELGTRVCCLEANVQIPRYFGTPFLYSIDRIVSFNGTSGLALNEVVTERESRDKRAIAIYIKTMRFGLVTAITVMMHRRVDFHVPPPVSLCCHTLLKGETNAQLIASPIPREEHQWKPGIRISQGEFFQVTKPTKSIFSGSVGLLWFFDSRNGDSFPLTHDLLIKVSCASVHNMYVSPSICNNALTKLYIECFNNADLKLSIETVLLGFCFRDDSMSLMSIIKDLRTGDKNFKMLEHKNFRGRKLSLLWDGFCDLINSLLLPMADVNIVHLDIRSSSELTYNILVYEEDTKIELSLIDFDSVVLSTAAAKIDATGQNDAIWWNQLGVAHESAYKYLFWQVLWIAFRWHPPAGAMTVGTQRMKANANNFVSSLFEDDEYVEFKSWLGNHFITLRQINIEKITREDVQKAVCTFQKAFKE
jgi:hypothetical protein